jgi:hypothetical protein
LPAGQPLLDPLALELDEELPAQLYLRPRQRYANIVPTPPS